MLQPKRIRIGTRESELALWQANTVAQKINKLGVATEIIAVKSTGDIILDKPLYELGITGIFTKTLDMALLQGTVDIAVHSMKDVPTSLPEGIKSFAVLERGNVKDILVLKEGEVDFENVNTIATGSLRRKAQWLHKFPSHNMVDLRGNVNSRLQKLEDNDWNGAIFAKAGLERINILPSQIIELNWMLPAPAQGAMLIVGLEEDAFCYGICKKLNHKNSEICTFIERQFLKVLEGGCSAPIGALAEIKNNSVCFSGNIFSLDGKEKVAIEKTCSVNNYFDFGKECALELLKNGADKIMQTMSKKL